jgi:hypothetical protein
LQELNCSANPLEDAGPLRDMPLEVLDISRTLLADLQPLQKAPLQQLDIRATQVIDIWPLEEVKSLRVLDCYFHAQRDAELLRSFTFLRRLNGHDRDAFWEAHDVRQASMSEWFPRVAALSEHEKVAAVAAKLQELNPGFDGHVFPNYNEGKVTVFQVFTDHLTDIEPLRAFTHLERLTIRGTDQGNGKLFDLYPLRDLPLVYLECGFNEITDLRALQGVPLRVLLCRGTLVRDLSPIRDLPLFYFECTSTPVDDLSPLTGRSISNLHIRSTRIRNYEPIARMNVHVLGADLDPVRDKSLLQSIATLEVLNDVPVADLWN